MNQQLKQLGLTPLKAGAIGVLLLLLAAVWGPQIASRFTGGSAPKFAQAPSPPNPSSHSRREPDARAAVAPREAPGAETRTATARTPARVYTLQDASSYDPFRAPPWAPQPEARAARTTPAGSGAERLASIEELQETGVAMVLVSESERVATIGDRVVRLGDEIDGFRVVEISSQGVLLLPADGAAPTRRPRDL